MKRYKNKFASEELNEISLKKSIPSFKWALLFIFSFIGIAILIGAFVKYPKKIIGIVYIISNVQPNKIYAPNSGKIELKVQENNEVKKGDLLAVIESPSSYKDILSLKKELDDFDINNIEHFIKENTYNANLKLGDIEHYYNEFNLSILEYKNITKINLTKQKINNIWDELKMNETKLEIEKDIANVSKIEKKIIEETYKEDSILYQKNAVVKQRFNESKKSLLGIREKEQAIKKRRQDLEHINKSLYDEVKLLNKEYEQVVVSSLFKIKKNFLELKTAIDYWEYNHIIKSPISGKIEYYQPFVTNNQYFKKDAPLFIILPKYDSIYARGVFSANGYGNIKEYDTLTIKLHDYPHKEHGEIEGIIRNKSKVYHDSIYFVDISLSKGMFTDHNKSIDFRYNMSGQAEYHTNKRSILQRIFDEIHNSIE